MFSKNGALIIRSMNDLTINGMKVYVPAKDHELSRRFYEELGFDVKEAWNGNYDCSLGPVIFRLQNYYVKDWAGNFMMQFEVNDAQAWYEKAKAIIDTGRYPTAKVMPTQDNGDVSITHVIDPSGVLLIFIQ